MNHGGLGYASYRLAPRAPRVAIVVKDGDAWQYWARRALHHATRVWGGAGFVLVPHENGVVHPRLLRAMSVYDPDYVLLHQPLLRDLEMTSPESVNIVGADGEELAPDLRTAMVERAGGTTGLPDHAGDAARDAVVQACSPYRRWDHSAAAWTEDHLWWPDRADCLPCKWHDFSTTAL